jgi:hypothetical protein
MALPPNTPTHEHYVSKQQSRLDNVFCTEHTMNLFNICEVLLDDPKPGTDHFPIISTIDLPVRHQEMPRRPDFRTTDWEAFNANLSNRLANNPPPAPLACKEDFRRACASLTEAIQDVIHTTIPLKRPCPHTKRWWSTDLKKLWQTMRRLYRQAQRLLDFPDHPIHQEARSSRTRYSTAIDKACKQHWTDWLEEVTTNDIWSAHRYISQPYGDGGRTTIPALQYQDTNGNMQLAATNEQKAEALAKTFFPAPPTNPLQGADQDSYPIDVPRLPSITKDQIR